MRGVFDGNAGTASPCLLSSAAASHPPAVAWVPGCSCENCGQLHEEDASELAYAHTNWADKVCVGPALSQLGGLRRLTVGIQGENEQVGAGTNGSRAGQEGRQRRQLSLHPPNAAPLPA